MPFQVFIRLADREDSEQPAPFSVDRNAKWTAVQHMLSSYYDDVCPDDLDVRYWDEEDFVIISSQEELEEALRLAEEEGRSYLQFHVRLMDRGSNSIPLDQQSSAGSSHGSAAAYTGRGEEVEKKSESRAESLASSISENTPPSEQKIMDRALAAGRHHSMAAAAAAVLDEMRLEAGQVSYDEGPAMEQAGEGASADRGHVMMPGALSGANVFAIDMTEMSTELEQQATETAEPAEIAETGEVSTKSSRDAETGFWMQPQLEAGVKAELIRKLSTVVTEKERIRPDRPKLTKKHERRSSRLDSGHKKKKHHGEESTQEESVSDFLMKEKSSSSLTSSSPLDAISEEVSSGTPPTHHKKHERKASKSEGKKKKHHSDLLTKDTFVHYMAKFEAQLRKDVAKEVAKKTVRSVIKNLPKQSEASETTSNPPAISSQRSGYVHDDIICDCCDREIVGTRYICGNCPNYDLCEECESIQPSFHDRSHVFIKLRRPCLKAGTRHGLRVPLLKRIIYEGKEEERVVNPERIEAIRQHTQGKNNNNQDGGGDPDDQGQEEEDKMSEKTCEMKACEVTDGGEESSVPSGHGTDIIVPLEDAASPFELLYLEMLKMGANQGLEHLYDGDLTEDNFVVYDPLLRRLMKEVRNGSPSSTEAVNGSQYPDCAEEGELTALTMEDQGVGPIPEQRQEQQMSNVSSLSSLTDESSSEEDFVVIVPDCFDISKPLDPASLARLSPEKSEDPNFRNQAEEGPDSYIPSPVFQLFTGATDEEASFWQGGIDKERDTDEDTTHTDILDILSDYGEVLSHQDEEERLRHLRHDVFSFIHARKVLFGLDEEAELKLTTEAVECQTEEEELKPTTEALECQTEEEELKHTMEALKYTMEALECQTEEEDRASLSVITEREGESSAEDGEADVQEMGCTSLQDVPSVSETSASQLQACAAVDQTPEQATEKASETENQSFTPDTEDSDVPDDDETDLKCPPESDEEGAAAAADSSLDPNQQLNQMMTNTLKKASTGLQHLFQAGKHIFRTLQSEEHSDCPDDYEPKESSYVFKPSDYKPPESTWQPSKSTYVMPKSTFEPVRSDFQMPKSTYTSPKSQISSGVCGEFALPLQRIREMGYFNNEHTLALLKKHEGDVQKVVNELVEETENDWADRRHGDHS